MELTTWIVRLNLKLKCYSQAFVATVMQEFLLKKFEVFPTLAADWQSKQITLKIDHHSITA